ncbi:MAG: beta-lactamase, partial [Flavipsychrobacter sp.]|nr:beta-lactamase [Flavipsychrobacter sp.]
MGRVFSVFTVFFIVFYMIFASAQQRKDVQVDPVKRKWVDSVYNKLNDRERIGQLFMVAAYSGGKDYNEDQIKQMIDSRQIGGVIFMGGNPEAQARLNNQYQRMAQVPLLVGMDAEWGLGMRLSGVDDMPKAMMIGATRDTALAYEVGKAIAAQCKRLGVHINFGPVVDVNNNPKNPIINARSFGEDKKWVAKLGIAYMRGLQDNGVMASAKHFPGHGDTDIDSHKDLPAIKKSLAQLESLELYPFNELIKAGVKSMMVAHLEVPALESAPHTPTTLSKNTVTNLLKTKMGFKGLVFTDALNMHGVAKYYAPGDVDLRAFIAGNDVLLFSQDVPTAISKIENAMNEGIVEKSDLEQRVKKILAAKYDAGLNKWKPVDVNNVTTDLNKYTASLRTRVAENAVTVIRDRNNILSDISRTGAQIQYVGVNSMGNTTLYNQLAEAYGNVNAAWLPANASESKGDEILRSIDKSGISIVAVHNMTFYPSGGDYGLTAKQLAFLKQAQKRTNVMLVVMGNPYILKMINEAPSIAVAYEDDDATENAVARLLAKELPARGYLPVTPYFNMKMEGLPVYAMNKAAVAGRLTTVDFVEKAGVVNPDALDKLNLFMQRAVAAGAFPGARVLAAKDGKIFYNECFGFCTPEKVDRVNPNTIYDVASLTKVMSTTLAVMRLYETGALQLDKTVGDYLPWTKGSNKANIKVRELLLHQGGLKAWIPFYTETLDASGNLRSDLYKTKRDANYTIEVAKDLYLRKDYPDTIWAQILASPLETKGRYVYSDLDYFFLAAIVQQISGKRIDNYVEANFYKPLGLERTGYNPLQRFKLSEIAPTENDAIFRHQQIQGYVHD